MSEFTCDVTVPSTFQEVEQAVQEYITADLSGAELLCLWQAIRDASLSQEFPEPESDQVPCEHSY